MDIRLLKDIVAVFENSTLTTMELEAENIKVKLKKEISRPAAAAPVASQPVQSVQRPQPATEYVKSPLVGTFYAAPAAGKPPFVQPGDYVNRGDTLCIIEAMKVMNEIKAPKAGWITDIKVKNGDMVRYDDDLIAIGDKNDS